MRRKMMDTLLDWKRGSDRRCLVIHGSRQIGKSFIINQFGIENYPNFLCLDFSRSSEDRDVFRDSITAEDIIWKLSIRYPEFKVEQGRSLLFLDEIQLCDDARSAIKPLVEDGRMDVIASGSLLGVMGLKRADDEGVFWRLDRWSKMGTGKIDECGIQESRSLERELDATVRESISEGRKRISPLGYERLVRMYPMDFEEYLWALGYSDEVIGRIRGYISRKEAIPEPALSVMDRLYRQYVLTGGMPAAVIRSSDGSGYDEVLGELESIMSGYYSDVLRYAPAALSPKIAGCVRSIPENLRRRNKNFRFSDVEGRSNVGWREYADPLTWVDSSGIMTVCNGLTEPSRPLRSNVGRYFKAFMCDTGLLMTALDDAERHSILEGDFSINEGGIAENSVANMLERCGLDLYCFERTYNSRGDLDRMELDFVLNMGSDLVAVEVKSGKNRSSPSLNKLLREEERAKHRFSRFIMFGRSNVYVDERGVEHYPLFAAAFADSMFDRPRMEFEGYTELDL